MTTHTSVKGFWDYWIGNYEPGMDPAGDRPVMYVKHLVYMTWPFTLVIDLHKMVRVDDPECYHTHPYNAWRVPLWGGYIEELLDGTLKVIWPLRIGRVTHDYCHMLRSMLFAKVTYSLWIRGRVKHKVQLHGAGWARQQVETQPRKRQSGDDL